MRLGSRSGKESIYIRKRRRRRLGMGLGLGYGLLNDDTLVLFMIVVAYEMNQLENILGENGKSFGSDFRIEQGANTITWGLSTITTMEEISILSGRYPKVTDASCRD